jgi:outer membrane protein assembly factor BamD (BamD/ComL family)
VGNKSVRKGNYILFYCAACFLIAGISIVSCAPVQETIVELKSNQQLVQYRENVAAGSFETVIAQSKQILAEDDTKPPADIALYSLGEVYAFHDFEGKDYNLSKYYFEKLINNFPDSRFTPEAKTYISLLDTIFAQERETAAVEEKLSEKEEQVAAAEIIIKKEMAAPEIIVEKEKKSAPASQHRKIVENKNFEEAAQKNLQILGEFGTKKPADEALYNLGLIYAHVDNPAKDYKKSKIYFHVLTMQFPESEFAEEARIWLGLFETIEKIQQIDVEIEQQKKQLTR